MADQMKGIPAEIKESVIVGVESGTFVVAEHVELVEYIPVFITSVETREPQHPWIC